MFTGIITATQPILAIDQGNFTIGKTTTDVVVMGQSIAHDGACMTVCNFGDDYYSFFAMQESLDKTNFASKKVGDVFNIEYCMIYGQRVDGHIVSGHIDTTATISMCNKNPDDSRMLGVSFAATFAEYCIPKGSISINGVSLTIVDIYTLDDSTTVSVCLIPYTWTHTNLSQVSLGSKVNIEFDSMGKYIVQTVRNIQGG